MAVVQPLKRVLVLTLEPRYLAVETATLRVPLLVRFVKPRRALIKCLGKLDRARLALVKLGSDLLNRRCLLRLKRRAQRRKRLSVVMFRLSGLGLERFDLGSLGLQRCVVLRLERTPRRIVLLLHGFRLACRRLL